jgi:hypothetical protein
METACLAGLRAYAAAGGPVPQGLVNELVEYNLALGYERKQIRDQIQRTLEDRPWERCSCAICTQVGIEVVIFRGNNRNRRRGFHNTHVFYELIARVLAGESLPWIETVVVPTPLPTQLTLSATGF